MIPLRGRTFTENDRGEGFAHGTSVVNSRYTYPAEALAAFRRKVEKDGAGAIEVLNKAPHLFPYLFKMDALEYAGVSAQEIVTIVTERWIQETKGFRTENPAFMPFLWWPLEDCFTHPIATSTKVLISDVRPTVAPAIEEQDDDDRGFGMFGEV